MSAPNLFSLPPITPELKSIVPYLQRAEEVKTQDPIVAYWCAYYAAQVGIGIKTRDSASREVLFSLLTVLERMKTETGSNDTINVEAASAAYVENFALRVFTVADNEDRNGHATRTTAKRFLAAANFLEVLKTFPKADVSESNGDKIRYAKWKAADIAKAFREGRQPAPGPPGYADELAQAQHNQALDPSPTMPTISALDAPKKSTITRSPPSAKNASPSLSIGPTPPSTPPDLPHRKFREDGLDARPAWGDATNAGDDWSTIATPGTAPDTSVLFSSRSETYGWGQDSLTKSATSGGEADQEGVGQARHKRSSSGSSSRSRGSGTSPQRTWVSDEREGKETLSPPSSPLRGHRSPMWLGDLKPSPPTFKGRNLSPGSDKKVHFTPSVIGGSTTIESTPTSPLHPEEEYGQNPLMFDPSLSHISSNANTDWSSPIPYPPPHPTIVSSTFPPPGSPPRHYGPTYTVPRQQPPPLPRPALMPAPAAPSVPIELTPRLITKVQKHCRFAISSLDYEDAETAKKELRVALALLGG